MVGRKQDSAEDPGGTDTRSAGKPRRADEAGTATPEGSARFGDSVAELERRLAGMVSVAPDAIVAIGDDVRIRAFNRGAEKLFGHTAIGIIGRPLDDLIPLRFRAAHARHVERFRTSPEQSRLMNERADIVGLRADGSEFPAEASVSKLEMDGETIMTVMLQDVTARKRAEAELVAAKEQAERALIQAEKLAAVGTLASGIGHEINNPLYMILGAAEAIRDGDDLAGGQELAREIIDSCKHIAEVIKNLTAYSRPADKHGLEPVDVNNAILEAISMVRRSPLTDTIEIEQRLNPVPAVSAKSEEIQQVFFNVIRNGLQAMDGAGALEIDSVQEGERVSIRIRDSGSGIAPENLARIYEPFFTTKGPDEGEGIGLFVVRQIVEKYDGTIDFESKVGEGTTCVITFPARERSSGGP